ncbi:MAG: AAA family ATPase [Lachnospiraceae bacterium]
MAENNAFRNDKLYIDYYSIFHDLKHHWWNGIIMGIALAILAYSLCDYIYVPKYEVTAVYVVNPKSSNYIDDSKSTETSVTIFKNILNSEVMKSKVLTELLEIEKEVEELSISASSVYQTSIVTLAVIGATPEEAFQVMSTVQSIFPSLIEDVMYDTLVTEIQKVSIPTEPIEDYEKELYTLITLFAGILLYMTTVIVLSIIRNTVKNENSFKDIFEIKLLSAIPYINYKNVDKNDYPLIHTYGGDFRYLESFLMLATRIMKMLDKRGAKTLLVSSVSPGEGKTTTAINLATAIAKNQKKVLLIDGDFRKPSIAKALNIPKEYDNYLERQILGEIISEEKLYKLNELGLFFLTNKNRHKSSSNLLNEKLFEEILENYKKSFDYIIVDSAPTSLVADTELLLHACDTSVIVVLEDFVHIANIGESIELLNEEHKLLGAVYKKRYKKIKNKK